MKHVSLRGPQAQGYRVNFSQCFGLARRSRQVKVEVPTLYNTRTRQTAAIPQALYSADQGLVSRLESDGWVVRTQRTVVPQNVYERVPVCCPWDSNCHQSQQNQVHTEMNAPCVNGGQLVYKDGQQTCQCPPGHRGLWCQISDNSGRPEPATNFPSGPVIRVASSSGPYMDQAIQQAEYLRRQQLAMNSPMYAPVPVQREVQPMSPYSQQAALWHQQALRARLSQLEDYARSRGYPFKRKMCVTCMKTLMGRPASMREMPTFGKWMYPNYMISRVNRPRPYFITPMNKPYRRMYMPPTSPRPVPKLRNPYAMTSSGQQTPYFMESSFTVQQEIQPMGNNPYSLTRGNSDVKYLVDRVQADRLPGNPYNNIPSQGQNYLPPIAKMPSARTPWDLDPFSQQQNPGFMNDPRLPNRLNRERQLLALAVFKELMNRRRSRLSTVTPSFRARQPVISPELAKTTTPVSESTKLPEPKEGEGSMPSGFPQMPSPEELAQMRVCQSVLEPQIKDCFLTQNLTAEQFMSPDFVEKSAQLCKNSADVGQCIQKLEGVCGESAAGVNKKVTDSLLRMIGMVCNQIMARASSQNAPEQQQPINDDDQTRAGVNESQGQGTDEEQSVPTLEEQQQMRQCQGVLEPMLNDCIKGHDLTLEQFMNPEYMKKAMDVCQDSTNVGECVKKLDNACGAPNTKTTKKMLNSILGMMGMVCQQIQAKGGVPVNKNMKEPVQEPEMTQTNQPKPETVPTTAQEGSEGQHEFPTADEIRVMQQCQSTVESGLNECLSSYDITIQQFVSPQFTEKASNVCQNGQSVGECLRKLENSCGEPQVIKKMLMSMMRMMTMVCQQVQSKAGDNHAPAAPSSQPVTAQESDETNQQRDGMPTQEDIQQMQQCQATLEPKINECLKGHDITFQQFNDPQFIDKVRKVCQDSQSVGPCIQQLDKSCGESYINTTRKMLKTVLGMLGMTCQQVPQNDQVDLSGTSQTQDGSPVTLEMLHKCETTLLSKVQDCLKDHSITFDQFLNPQFKDKSRAVCQNGEAVRQCVEKLDTECGGEATKRMIRSVLHMMGTACNNIMNQAQGNSIPSHRGTLLRSGHMPQIPEKKPEENAGQVYNNPKQSTPTKTESITNDEDKDLIAGNLVHGPAAKAMTGEDVVKYTSRDLEIFGYPLWLILTLILILVILVLLFVMVICLCVRRKKKQRKVIITKEASEKPPLPEDTMCTIGIPPPSYTITTVQQNEDGLALPPIDLGEDTVSVSVDDRANEKPPLDDIDNSSGKY
ncbi:hypothetical protein Btru_061823 [Bulinus truncatus]|nr:hypothetical protein Btru_061823 [Bulinus truncatus]